MRQAVARIPTPVWALGIVSLLPFYIGAGLYCYAPPNLHPIGLGLLLAWSAVTLGYLGGIRAGLELNRDGKPRGSSLSLSMLSPLAGFALLIGGPLLNFDAVWQVSGFMTAFLLMWLWDVRSINGPAWRPRFRTLITAGATIALAAALEQALSM